MIKEVKMEKKIPPIPILQPEQIKSFIFLPVEKRTSFPLTLCDKNCVGSCYGEMFLQPTEAEWGLYYISHIVEKLPKVKETFWNKLNEQEFTSLELAF